MEERDIQTFRRALLQWYRAQGRDLPWRRTTDAYAVLVSELMLQQTQVDRVIPKYFAFLEAFPTVQALADAAQGDVLRMWAGLGYNSRALRLHQLAKVVVERHGGSVPSEIAELRALPGIGAYTAGAVRTFGHRLPASFIDINIKRIIHRVFAGPEYPDWQMTDAELDAAAEQLAPKDADVYDYHQGLMDVGAMLCGSTRTDCPACPFFAMCRTRVALESQPLLLAEGRRLKAQKKPRETFKTSMRFLRGRIVDTLRAHPAGLQKEPLEEMLGALGVPQLERLSTALEALTKEGLIHDRKGLYSL